jgi:hypothetical protein
MERLIPIHFLNISQLKSRVKIVTSAENLHFFFRIDLVYIKLFFSSFSLNSEEIVYFHAKESSEKVFINLI